MAKMTANHNKLYFDTLCRTQKGESVLSLIHATYQAKKNCKTGDDVKANIASRLENAYNLFKKEAGSYSGSLSQFESQYTIGHELCIWKNKELDLTELAKKVAENYITIRDYFDIVFLNYFQPINNKIVHILYHLLVYMKDNGLNSVSKEQMGKAYMSVSGATEPGEVNGAYNMLIASSYFKADSSGKELIFIANCAIDSLIERCNTTYVQKGYEVAKTDLAKEEDYIRYLLDDHRLIEESKEDNCEYTQEELAQELKKLYESFGSVGVHLFGVRRGKYIRAKKYKLNDICIEAGMSSNYGREIDKGTRLSKYVSEKSNYDEQVLEIQDDDNTLEESNLDVIIDYSDFVQGGTNIIYYGTPGCGKSWYVENALLKDVPDQFKFRTTFYMDYTHTDFVGQLMPVVEKNKDENGNNLEKVMYKFVPGPFTVALETAYRNPKQMVYLVIEEINRGNAASILGDLFQLLDREKEDNPHGNPIGQSTYLIDKIDICNYFRDEKKIILPNNKLFIPSNLSLIGTMNTNDQNVSTLDTAFKRRWKMRKISNIFTNDHPYASKYVPGTNVSWKMFVEGINKEIVSDATSSINAEDKQIGQYFIDSVELEFEPFVKIEERQRAFAYKMLEYLWSNVAKYDRATWFKDDPKTLDTLVDNFVDKGVDVFEGDMFNVEEESDVQMHTDNGEEE